MAYSQALAERVRDELAAVSDLSEREMFGGIGFMIGGNMACGIIGDELMVRVGPDLYHDALTRPDAREFDLTGRPMRGWVTVAASGLAADDDLEMWVGLGRAFAQSLPAKSKPPSGKRSTVAKLATKKKPVAKKPSAKKPVAKKSAAQKPSAKKPVAKKSATKKPSTKKPAAKKAATKKRTAKNPSARKPAKGQAKRPARRR